MLIDVLPDPGFTCRYSDVENIPDYCLDTLLLKDAPKVAPGMEHENQG